MSMSIALVAMPWEYESVPSLALGRWATLLRNNTTANVECYYEYLNVAKRVGALYRPVSYGQQIGEVLYATIRTECLDEAQAAFVAWSLAERREYFWFQNDAWPAGRSIDHFAFLRREISAHLDELVDQLASRHGAIVLPSSRNQLWSSLTLAHRLKSLDQSIKTILAVSKQWWARRATCPVLADIDHIISEEEAGTLLSALNLSPEPSMRSHAISDHSTPFAISADREVQRIGVPDFGEFAAAIADLGEPKWHIPLDFPQSEDGSCPIKFARHVTDEVVRQSDRYENLRFLVVSSPLRDQGGSRLATAVSRANRSMGVFCSIDVSMDPYTVFKLWQSGCAMVELSSMGLTTGQLRHLGHGSCAIDVLHAMRICYELGVNNLSFFPTHIDGMTQAEVDQAIDILDRFGTLYQPVRIRDNSLMRRVCTSVIARNHLQGSADPWCWMNVPDSSPLCESGDTPSWQRIEAVVRRWRDLHRRLLFLDGVSWFVGARPLYYYDGDAFLNIIDRRLHHQELRLDKLGRDLYLYCTQIRSRDAVHTEFGDRYVAADIDACLDECSQHDLVFCEQDRVLSLAVAYRVELATQRIRKTHAQERGRKHRKSFSRT